MGKGICLGLILVGMNACFYHIFFPYINIMKFCFALMFVGMYATVVTISPFQSLEIKARKKLELKRIKNPVSLFVLIITIVLTAIYVMNNILRYQSDARFLWDAIQRRYDIYYHYETNWLSMARYDSNGADLLFTVEFVLAFLMAVAFYKLRSMTLGLIPLTIIVSLGLIWGEAPEVIDMVLLVAGVIGMRILMEESHGKGKKYFRQLPGKGGRQKNVYPVIAVLLAAVLLASSILSAKNQSVLDKEKELVAWQKGVGQTLEKKAIQMVKRLQRMAGTEQPGVLTNTYPVYEEVPVLKITVDKMPMGNVYLRGFTGTNYEDGKWTNPAKEDEFTREEYINVWEEAYKNKKEILKQDFMEQFAYSEKEINMNIQYAQGNNTPYVYIPYYSKLSSDSLDQLQMNRDLNFERGSSVQEYDVTMLQNSAGVEELVRQSEYIWDSQHVIQMMQALEIKGEEHYNRLYSYSGTEEKVTEEELKYQEYVGQENMQIPEEGLEGVERLVKRWKNQGELVDSAEASNIEHAIRSIKYVLNMRTDYSKNLQKKPANEDYLEYFLMTQKKGFCEHYATAGTIILRMLDFPARYVSGYMVSPKQFEQNADGTYTALVLDSDAHAWAEVYTPQIGWLEADMTPAGNSSNTLGSDQEWKEPVDRTTQKPERTEKPESLKSPEEEEIDEEEPEETPAQKEASSQPEETKAGEDFGIPGAGDGNTGTGGWSKVLLPAGCSVTVVAVLILLWWSQRARRRKRLRCCESNRETILEMNRQMERFLRCCGIRGLSKKTDKEYIALLKYFCPKPEMKEEISRYFQILEQARFAKEDRSKEDVTWCEKLLYDFGRVLLKEKGRLRHIYVRGLRNWR